MTTSTRRLQAVVLFAASACLALTMPLAAQDPSPAQIDAVFADFDAASSPGCALGVYRDGELVYEKGYGMANLDWGIEIDPSTVFYVGSVSKQFTAAAIALLARGGQLSLNDDIREFLPELPEYDTPVTVGHLVHHTGGMMDMYAAMMDSGMNIFDPIENGEAVEVLASKPLDFEPGDRFSYSNGGYFLLSQIVERASGMSFTEFTTTNLFEPLGMGDTHFHGDAGHIVPRRAMSYEGGNSGELRQNYVSTFGFVGQGGLYTTVGDLIKWDRNFYESRVGGAGFTEFVETRGVLNGGETIDYAFGLRHAVYRGQHTVGHSGGMMGFRAYMERFPDQRFTVSALCNQSEIDPGVLARKVADLYLADVLESGS
ncbi:MAG: beta-lactamase family protein [Gemmatimonadota bacterium]|nr:beta-lactamase family protein [Gemmatimonadota bacterium]